jgi:hypothetical protein
MTFAALMTKYPKSMKKIIFRLSLKKGGKKISFKNWGLI